MSESRNGEVVYQAVVKCLNCGAEQFEIPSEHNAETDCTCTGCGNVYKYGVLDEFRRQHGREVRNNIVADLAANLFKKK